jgi:signal transduction histidine kinase/HAMP domain-containing protein
MTQPRRSPSGTSLRILLTVPFMLQLGLAVGLTGFLSWRNSQRAVSQLATQVQSETGMRVKTTLEGYLEKPRLIAQLNAQAIEEGHITFQNLPSIERHLLHQLQQFRNVSGILVGSIAGDLRAVNRRDGLHLLRANRLNSTPTLENYRINDQGQILSLQGKIAKDFRQAPWFRSAIGQGELIWSPIFQTNDHPDLSLNANIPFLDREGRILGVMSCGIVLSFIDQLLQHLDVSPSGLVFVMERSGELVSNSSKTTPSYLTQQQGSTVKLQRIPATQSQNLLLKTTASELLDQTGSFDRIPPTGLQLTFSIKGEKNYVKVIPCSDGYGINWLIVVVTPERDFMGEINANTRSTILLWVLGLLAAITLGLLTANWIATPILRLSRASRAMAQGKQYHPLSEQQPVRELASLANSFNHMATQVRSSLDILEAQVGERTQLLQQSFDFEATVNRITDRVRDSLDEDQILQTAVEALALALNSRGCNAALYDLPRGVSNVKYEYTTFTKQLQGRVIELSNFAGYSQLLQGEYFQCCSLEPIPERGYVVTLACPMRDDQGVLGDLWLINPADTAFDDQEIRLAQQVATQCAIAIRQAQLYQAAQAQVSELERLNQLKDDFLSTVSHELRTPISNMKMATQMLEINLTRLKILGDEAGSDVNPSVARYFQILKDECQRETRLINDLLDLSQLDTASEPPNPTAIELSPWLQSLVIPYEERSRDRHQFYLKLPRTLPVVHTDPLLLSRILTELLENAYKYTPEEELIVVAVSPIEQALSFSVTNSGITIPENERKRIFERFYRIPNSDPWKHGGTGLGLALAKRLTDRLGGTLHVSSQDNMTTFTLHLPC